MLQKHEGLYRVTEYLKRQMVLGACPSKFAEYMVIWQT
jgi:hypothetical protein